MKRVLRMAAAIAMGLVVASAARTSRADTDDIDVAAEWSRQYEDARRHLVAGEFTLARSEFLQLAAAAPTELDRRLVMEMAALAQRWASIDDEATRAAVGDSAAAVKRTARTRDEITLLYATSFFYGAGTGAWFLLQTQPDTALSATLPFAGFTAAPVVALAVIDGQRPLLHGVPHGIAAGAYVGLGEASLVVAYQHARAHRLEAGRPEGETKRWAAPDVASVLWGGATLGAVTGGAIAAALPTTPGRASYTASAAIWGGVLTGFVVGAALPETAHRTEDTALGAAIGYNVGLAVGITTAAPVSPSTTRVRLIDLAGVAGGLAVGGTYMGASGGGDPRISLATAAAGAAAGLGIGWVLTSDMTPARADGERPPAATSTIKVVPIPTPNGVGAGVAGSF